MATLSGHDLTLGQIYDLDGGIGSITASADTIEVAGIDTRSVSGNVDLKATGNLTVDSGATIETGMGRSRWRQTSRQMARATTAWARSRSERAPGSSATNPTTSAITLRGADIDIDTSDNPAVISVQSLPVRTPTSIAYRG